MKIIYHCLLIITHVVASGKETYTLFISAYTSVDFCLCVCSHVCLYVGVDRFLIPENIIFNRLGAILNNIKAKFSLNQFNIMNSLSRVEAPDMHL